MHDSYASTLTFLYDQSSPVGRLGRGTHYSILRAVLFRSQSSVIGDPAIFHDVAVVWDEDHDGRLLRVVEAIYLAGLLWPILFVGERKGMLHVLISPESAHELGNHGISDFRERLGSCARLEDDVWSVEVATHTLEPTGIIAADAESVQVYLKSIDLLWDLGSKPATVAA